MANGRPQRHITDREYIRVATAEHEVNFRRPRTDATKRNQFGKGNTRLPAHHAIKIDLPFRDGARQPFQRRRLGT